MRKEKQKKRGNGSIFNPLQKSAHNVLQLSKICSCLDMGHRQKIDLMLGLNNSFFLDKPENIINLISLDEEKIIKDFIEQTTLVLRFEPVT